MHGQNILLKRLQNIAADRPLAVVVGSALSVTYRAKPLAPLGVPGVGGMLAAVRGALRKAGAESDLDAALRETPEAAHYQAAFDLADAVLGADGVNAIVHAGVLQARLPEAPAAFDGDGEPRHWHIPRGTAALGRLLAAAEHPFTGPVLTTNFDPLISLAIKAAGGAPDRRTLSTDGRLHGPAEAEGGPRVVHLHGYWRGDDTLHTAAQLTRARPALRGALRTLLARHVVLVTGYGGWDDAFMQALADAAAESAGKARVLWALFGDEAQARHENKALLAKYDGRPGIRFYCGVDAHDLFGTLAPSTAQPAPAPPPAAAPPADDRPIKMGQPGFAVPAFPAEAGTMIGGAPLIAELHALLAAGGVAGIGQAAAVGLGGLGKSRLAWEYAHAHRDDYPGGVLWFDADPQADLDGQLADIARELRWVGPASDDLGALAVGRAALRELERALIIFDNVEDLRRVAHLRPQQPCAVLVTSRLDQSLPVLDMKCLGEDAGAELLAHASHRPLDAPADLDAARAISAWAEGLPLALELIGAYLARRSTATWPGVLERLKAHALKARPLKPGRAGFDAPIHGGQTVEAALQLEPRLLEDYPALGRALDMLSGLAPTAMGLDLLSTLVDADHPEALTEALEAACTLRIVSRTAGGQPRYRMHRLVRAVYRASQSGAPLDAPTMARLVGWFRDRRKDLTGTTAFAGEGDHLEAARALCEATPALHERAALYWLEAHIAWARGDYRAALTLVDRAQTVWAGGPDEALALEIEIDQAGLQSALGDVRPALAALEAIVERAERSAAPPEVRVQALRALAHKQHLLGSEDPARKTAARALEVAEATWGAGHWRAAEVRSQWAVHAAQADPNEAAQASEHARRAFQQLRTAHGPGDHRTLSAHDNLGVCLAAAGRYADATAEGLDVLAERERHLGPDHPLTLHAVKNLAIAYNNRGEGPAARTCAQRALRGFQRLYGAEHRDAVVARIELIRSARGPRNARQIALRLMTLRKSLPADHSQRSRIDRYISQLTPNPPRGRRKNRKR